MQVKDSGATCNQRSCPLARAWISVIQAQILSHWDTKKSGKPRVGIPQREAAFDNACIWEHIPTVLSPKWCIRTCCQCSHCQYLWVSSSTPDKQKGQVASKPPLEDRCTRSAVITDPLHDETKNRSWCLRCLLQHLSQNFSVNIFISFMPLISCSYLSCLSDHSARIIKYQLKERWILGTTYEPWKITLRLFSLGGSHT